MLISPVPVKTPQGHEELSQRVRRLSQRHRTLLLLIDGRRQVEQVLQMAAAAGVPAECFHELVDLGLVALTLPAQGTDIYLPELDLPEPHVDSALPSAQALLPDADGVSPPAGPELPPAGPTDPQLEEAREMLLRAVRNEAPVTGSLTAMKLKRAASRDELGALLDEVEQRIRKPRKQLITAQLLRQVKHLLSLPPTIS